MHMVAGLCELYELLLPRRLSTSQKARTSSTVKFMCGLCGLVSESIAYILSGWAVLAWNKNLCCHNSILKVLFFWELKRIKSVPHCYSPMMAKPQCESDEMQTYWDVQIYAKHQEVRVNRVDACIINLKTKQVTTLEMSCPWAWNWEEKNEKTLKYRPLR